MSNNTFKFWVIFLLLLILVSTCANGGERWDRVKDWGRENWKPLAACAAGTAIIREEVRRREKAEIKTTRLEREVELNNTRKLAAHAEAQYEAYDEWARAIMCREPGCRHYAQYVEHDNNYKHWLAVHKRLDTQRRWLSQRGRNYKYIRRELSVDWNKRRKSAVAIAASFCAFTIKR